MTASNSLSHHGIKGMHWGTHKSGGSGGSSPAKPQKPTTQDIHEARSRQNARANKLNNLADDYQLASKKGQVKIGSLMGKLGDEFYDGSDAKMAARSTKGEKWAAAFAWGALATTSAAAIALSASGSRRL